MTSPAPKLAPIELTEATGQLDVATGVANRPVRNRLPLGKGIEADRFKVYGRVQSWIKVEARPYKWTNAQRSVVKVKREVDEMPLVRARLDALKEIAADEEIAWSEAAETQLLDFMRSVDGVRKPAIALDSNGDLRVLWERNAGEQVAIRFSGRSTVGAVLFASNQHGEVIHETVRASTSIVVKVIDNLGLSAVMVA